MSVKDRRSYPSIISTGLGKSLSFIRAGFRVIASKYLGKKPPVFLIFELTHSCNSRCLYCARWKETESAPIDTGEVKRILFEAKELGLIRAYFTGGEVFLRKDLSEILVFCKELGIKTEVWSNGYFIPGEQHVLDLVDSISLSLDGKAAKHDRLRGSGSFADTLLAAKLAKEKNVAVSFNFTLTSYNAGGFMEAFDIARSLDATLGFQPVADMFGCSQDVAMLIPSHEEFKLELDQVIAIKKEFPLVIENSLAQLSSLKSWPNIKRWSCLHGKAIFTVLPDGKIVNCTNGKELSSAIDLKQHSLEDALRNLPSSEGCGGCFCYAAFDASGAGGILPISPEVFNFYVSRKWIN